MDKNDALLDLQPFNYIRRHNLNLLYALDAILSSRSLTDAGRRVLLSQPAMSGALKKLRYEFEDELVIYLANERMLTPLAEILRPKVRTLINDIENTLQTRVTFDPATARRQLRITATESLEMILLSRFVPKLLQTAPNIELDITPLAHRTVAEAFDNGADLVVAPSRYHDPRFRMQKLINDNLACLACEANTEVDSEMTEQQFIASRHAAIFEPLESFSYLNQSAQDLLKGRKVAVRTAHFSALPRLVSGGKIIAIGSNWLFQEFASRMPVKVIAIPFLASEQAITVQWPEHKEVDPVYAWLLAEIRSSLQF